MERFVRIALLSLIAGLGAVGFQFALLVIEGFWTPFTINGLWHDIAGEAPPFGRLLAQVFDHSVGAQLALGGFVVLLGSIIAEDIFIHRRRAPRTRNRRAANS